MALSKQQFSNFIKEFKFRELFNEMGWDNDKTTQPIVVDQTTFQLKAVAVKSGFKILVCNPTFDGSIPDYSTRKKIEGKVTKLFQEHLVIFTDLKQQKQIWQLVIRESGKPIKVTETHYNILQDPQLLYQRASGLFFELDEEEHITIVDVTKRVADNFHQNNEKVTKQFYDRFKEQHKGFIKFIKGIDDKVNQEWYASLMLNRLMFCYFIQKKGFLDNNTNYLSDKLKQCKDKKGKNKFYSFYRNFLLQLFHQGLGAPNHTEELKEEIGKIPYLNGGLFDEHTLEKNNTTIEIEDKAFESIFKFFNEWEWHLDTRHAASGKDINPDVIGHIFEKYINDRADMGAYYTKEDITDYISKNSILPFLFDSTRRMLPKFFDLDSELWKTIKNSGDKYIYDAVKKGVGEKLPKEISDGIKDISLRTEWNKLATEQFALPKEIWREVIERRSRYKELKDKIENGEIKSFNDFITYNLNIRQFAVDSISNTNDAEFLKAFYKALNNVTIIDPTCGSGAFLFAAMNILDELYEQCIQRMENFINDFPKGKFKFFEETIENVKSLEHPNLSYFIYKNIILRNLYGVDIMKEAVEIAKLRLFLKLVSTVQVDYRKPNLGLEPLPDIDFNIRSGNTLVGFATEEELRKGLDWTFDGHEAKPIIEEKCEIVAKAFTRYKDIQLTHGDDYKAFKKAKEDLNMRLCELNNELNLLLYKQAEKLKYDKWVETYKPFHWFAEFYEIVSSKGGFDVVIGNPPYVEYKDVKSTYVVKGFQSLDSSDLYAFVMERSLHLSNEFSKIGFIIPMSCFTVDGFSSIQNLYFKNNHCIYISNWSGDAHPSKLFEGVDKRLHIVLSSKCKINSSTECLTFVTRYIKWYSEERKTLFDTKPSYFLLDRTEAPIFQTSIPKISSKIEESILKKLKRSKTVAHIQSASPTTDVVYYTRKVSFFLQFLDFIPIVKDSKGKVREPSELKTIHFSNTHIKNIVLSALNSSTFYWYYIINSDCRNLNKREIVHFNIPDIDSAYKKIFSQLLKKLMADYDSNSSMRTVTYKDKGDITVQYFNFRLSKPIIDQIDTALSEYYGFNDEELDFLINYDIKYRLGKELEEETKQI